METVTDAVVLWLAANPHLSAASLAAYRGEAYRFAEHLAESGLRHMIEVTETHWTGYLRTLVDGKRTLVSRRTAALKISSALQTARITRAFMRHCWAQRWINWTPAPGSCRTGANVSRKPTSVPTILADVLLSGSSDESETLARARCIYGLAFWAALKPREIVRLRCSALGGQTTATATATVKHMAIWIEGRAHEVDLPNLLVSQIHRYWLLRDGGAASPPEGTDPPVVSRLRSYEDLSTNSAWNVLKTWPPDGRNVKSSQRMGSRSVRDSFVTLACAEASFEIVDASRQAGRRPKLSELETKGRLDGSPEAVNVVLRRLFERRPSA